jgi:hypothetical protein
MLGLNDVRYAFSNDALTQTSIHTNKQLMPRIWQNKSLFST